MRKTIAFFVVALLVQLGILAAVPAQNVYTRLTGTPIVLKVAPVDPYSIMSGYYVTLTYEISAPPRPRWIRSPDGGTWATAPAPEDLTHAFTVFDKIPDGATVYVALEEKDGVWSARSIGETRPASGLFIRGIKRYSQIDFGIERYYIPEDARQKIDADLRDHMNDARVHVRVDSSGRAVIEWLAIQDRVYRY